MTQILVHADSTYPVEVRAQARWDVRQHIGGADRIAIIHPQAMRNAGDELKTFLHDLDVVTIEIPNGEDAKTISVLEFCWTALGNAGFTRNDVIVSLGGGATTDLAGFVAATWLRGIRIVHLPTTLLAMVDAAVGGKTGINTVEGKNLVGSFYSPAAVICDLDYLQSQDRADYVSGLAEIIKAGFIRDPQILTLIESDPQQATDPSWLHTEEIIARAIQVKADVVSHDLRETLGTSVGREILNFGHTFAHAIEQVEKYTWRHGDAVSVGMIYVGELATMAGLMPTTMLHRMRAILADVGLPTTYTAGEWPQLLAAMKIDKKSRGNTLRFVVLRDLAQPEIFSDPDAALLFAAYQQVGQS